MTPIILIHGYPLDHTLWRDVVPLLEKETAVYTPCLPGFGDNPTLPQKPSFDHIADHLLGTYELHQLSTAAIFGMSMGGYVALAFAEKYPEKLAALGLVSSQTGADSEEGRAGRFKMIQKINHEGAKVAAEAIAPKMFAPANAERFKAVVYEGAEKARAQGLTWALEAMANRPDRTGILKNLSVPVAIIHGTEDQIIPAEKAKNLASQLPRSLYTEIPGAGHGSPLEAPEAVAKAILELTRRATSEIPPTTTRKSNLPPITIAPTEHGL